MNWKRFLQRTLALLLIGICSISLLQPAVASAASTTQKSATVKFTKLKINGYTDISYFSSIGEYIVVFGKKKNGHIMSYSKDGKTFKDLNLDTYVTKKFDKKNFKEITFSSHPSFISKRNAAFIVGQGVVDDVDKENFIIKMSTDFKSVEVNPFK